METIFYEDFKLMSFDILSSCLNVLYKKIIPTPVSINQSESTAKPISFFTQTRKKLTLSNKTDLRSKIDNSNLSNFHWASLSIIVKDNAAFYVQNNLYDGAQFSMSYFIYIDLNIQCFCYIFWYHLKHKESNEKNIQFCLSHQFKSQIII